MDAPFHTECKTNKFLSFNGCTSKEINLFSTFHNCTQKQLAKKNTHNLQILRFICCSNTDLSVKKSHGTPNRTAGKYSPMKATLPLKAASKHQQKPQQPQIVNNTTYNPSERNIESEYAISVGIQDLTLGGGRPKTLSLFGGNLCQKKELGHVPPRYTTACNTSLSLSVYTFYHVKFNTKLELEMSI